MTAKRTGSKEITRCELPEIQSFVVDVGLVRDIVDVLTLNDALSDAIKPDKTYVGHGSVTFEGDSVRIWLSVDSE